MGLQTLVELLHHTAETRQLFFLLKNIKQWGIILVDDHHHLLTRLLTGTTDETSKHLAWCGLCL